VAYRAFFQGVNVYGVVMKYGVCDASPFIVVHGSMKAKWLIL
jgi:hypothetical protein